MGEVIHLFDTDSMTDPELAQYYRRAEDNAEASVDAMRVVMSIFEARAATGFLRGLQAPDRFDVFPDDPA